MKKILKRIAAINDLSSFGKCSLTVVIPILSKMGFEVCPVVTAYLSAHTGFKNPVIVDMTDKTKQVLDHIDSLGVDFDCIFTGYISTNEQIETIKTYVANKKSQETLILVDPVLGDENKLYTAFDQKSIYKMRELCLFADIVTPNFTEACFLAGLSYSESITEEMAEYLIYKLNAFGINNKIVITSVPFSDGNRKIIVSEYGEYKILDCGYVKGEFCGAGDAFSSVLCGKYLSGESLEKSVEFAHNFVKGVINETINLGGTWEQGIVLEKFLNLL